MPFSIKEWPYPTGYVQVCSELAVFDRYLDNSREELLLSDQKRIIQLKISRKVTCRLGLFRAIKQRNGLGLALVNKSVGKLNDDIEYNLIVFGIVKVLLTSNSRVY